MVLLIKLSGAALGSEEHKYREETLRNIAGQISSLLEAGHQVSMVVGGGNLFRGKDLAGKLSVKQATADYIGMLATVQNALVIRDYFESCDIPTRVSSAIAMPQVCEEYIPQKAKRHMQKGRVVVFAAGLGVPFFTTDSCAVERALEIRADYLVMAKDHVDGLYTGDPRHDPEAQFIAETTGSKVLEENLRVADSSAIALAKDHGLPIRVIGTSDIHRVTTDNVGSTVHPE